MDSDSRTARAIGPVSFADLLHEELAEIERLRKGRAWTGDVPPPNPSSITREASNSNDGKAIIHEEHREARQEGDETFRKADGSNLVGLALSGGGIRSATFNLGVLQGFAKFGLLPMFDYLSTVSGGGYIGAWLESWIYREGLTETHKRMSTDQCGEPSLTDRSLILRKVQGCLDPNRSDKLEHGEPQAIRFLREYSNYLTPRMGFLGADTWTAVAIYLRNVILNQAILILFLSFLLLIPYLAVYVTQILQAFSCPNLPYTAPVIAALLLLLAFCGVANNLRHLTGIDQTGEFPPSARQGWVLAYVATPLFLAAWCISAWVSHQYVEGQGSRLEDSWMWTKVGALGFWIVWFPVAFWGIWSGGKDNKFWNTSPTRLISSGCSAIAGAVGGLLFWVIADKIFCRWSQLNGPIWHTVSFGPPLVMAVFLLTMTLQLGLMGMLSPDPRREWWARLGGWLLLISIVWSALFALSIYSPLAVVWSRRLLTYGSGVWLLTTLTGVLGGKNSKTGSLESHSWTDAALSVTPYVFILGLGAGLATLLEIVLGKLNCREALAEFLKGSELPKKVSAWIISLDWSSLSIGASSAYVQGTLAPASPNSMHPTAFVAAHWRNLCGALNTNLLALAAIVAALCLVLAWRVDLNDFSMNLFYRNRLVRSYLGASNTRRKPNPFTGLDPHDDLFVSCLQSKHGYCGPFPILNTALNLVAGQNLAWQERKAESFVITPLRCGFDTWVERLDLKAESTALLGTAIEKFGFRPAELCLHPNKFYNPGGFRLGTAISISGAAASPNMGYHSNPALAFLMTFFNVRLGFWVGNPRHKSTWRKAGPNVGLFRLISELFGQSDDESRYVYLSDGGHFENLGLYELVKRRCRYIVVCDADSDPTYSFSDLGNAIRKCREDIGVEITIHTQGVGPMPREATIAAPQGVAAQVAATVGGFGEHHWAVGTINYSTVDPGGSKGVLLYLKTSLTGDEPVDVLSYHKEHLDFPHQTTADQWFTESQFEGHRRLGQHVVEQLFEETFDATEFHRSFSTKEIFDGLDKKWNTARTGAKTIAPTNGGGPNGEQDRMG